MIKVSKEFAQEIVENYCYVIASYRFVKPFDRGEDNTILKNISFDNGRVTFTVPNKYRDIYIEGLSQKRTAPAEGLMDIYYKIDGKNNYAEEVMRASLLFKRFCYDVHDSEYCERIEG